ncbi:MAG: hypothetical protein OXC83_01195 [Chloroflexi bacterium]|nr:hypothetical protein [Chloroflexota bacterium]
MQDATIYSIQVTDERAETIVIDLLERMLRTGASPTSEGDHIEATVAALLVGMGYDVLSVRHIPAIEDGKPSQLQACIKTA